MWKTHVGLLDLKKTSAYRCEGRTNCCVRSSQYKWQICRSTGCMHTLCPRRHSPACTVHRDSVPPPEQPPRGLLQQYTVNKPGTSPVCALLRPVQGRGALSVQAGHQADLQYSHQQQHQPASARTQPLAKLQLAEAARKLPVPPQSPLGKFAAPSHKQQQQHLQATLAGQQGLSSDPYADDLDFLAAAAAAVVPTSPTVSPPSAASSLTGSSDGQHAAALFSPISSIPEAGPRYLVPAGRTPRYTAVDKLQLSGAEMRDIGRRLRRMRADRGSVLRVFRYGVDDLRLYKAVDEAGLEGRLVVVDSTADADAVLTTYSKRTHKNVNLATAKRAAAGAGVPLLVLPAVSAQRLVEAVGPLMGLPTVDDSVSAAGPHGLHTLPGRQQAGATYEPRVLRWDEMEGDGSEELLQLMWGSTSSSSAGLSGTESQSNAPWPVAAGAAGACSPSPRWWAWCAAQEASPGCVAELAAAVRDADVEDARDQAVPLNPTARAGERHRLMKPWRPFSRIKRRKLRHDLARRTVSW